LPSGYHPPHAIRFWASSDLDAATLPLVRHLATRWEIELFFEDCKDVWGLDHYQLMSASAIIRSWTLVMLAYVFLDEQRTRLGLEQHRHLSIAQVRQTIQPTHYCQLIDWIHQQSSDAITPPALYDTLAA
jgi:Transposase DDE domain